MENIPWKKILTALGFLAAVIVFGFLIYVMFFRPIAPTEPTQPPSGIGAFLPLIPIGGPTPITTPPTGLPIEGPTAVEPSPVANCGLTQTTLAIDQRTVGLTQDGSAINYYLPSDGKFYQLTPDGKAVALSDQVFYNVDNITWSPDKNRAVLEYPDGSNTIYDFRAAKQYTLPKHWQEFSFSPTGDQLAFKSLGLDPSSRWLAVSDSSGGSQQAIENIGNNDQFIKIDWSPTRQIIASYQEFSAADRQELYFIGLNEENFKSVVVPGVGFRSQWTPDGQNLLFSASSAMTGYKPTLWIVNASGDQIGEGRQNLGIETWADKCTFRSNTDIICAVPRELPNGAGLAPDVSRDIPDDIYSINLTNGQKSLLARPTTDISINNLQLTNDGSALYMQDAASGRLYRIAL